MRITSVTLPEELHARLHERAEREDRSVSSAVRVAVNEWLNDEPGHNGNGHHQKP